MINEKKLLSDLDSEFEGGNIFGKAAADILKKIVERQPFIDMQDTIRQVRSLHSIDAESGENGRAFSAGWMQACDEFAKRLSASETKLPTPDYTPQYDMAVEKLGTDLADQLFNDADAFGDWIERMIWHVKKCNEYYAQIKQLEAKEKEVLDASRPHEWHMKTAAGVISSYFYPGSFGSQLSVQWKPTDCDEELDLVCIECKEDAGQDTDIDRIHVYLYRDVTTEDWTDKFSVSACKACEYVAEDKGGKL